jgi:hypothetical protein
MASNAANQIFTNAAPTTYTVDWSRIVLFVILFAVICAIAYFVYVNFVAKTTTMSYPFHQDILSKWSEWYGPSVSSYKPELIQPEHDKKSEEVTSDHTKLTGKNPELIGTPTTIVPPSSQPTATPSAVDAIAESIVHNGESNEDKRERKREREQRSEQRSEQKQEKQWKRPQDERENWCFVGEDLSGRYCVRVPSDKQCTSERLFHSRVDCEMAAANHLPAGVLTRNGDKYVPLATQNIV